MTWLVTVQPLSIWRWGAEEERWLRLTGFSQPGGAVIDTFLTKAKTFYVQKSSTLLFAFTNFHSLIPEFIPWVDERHSIYIRSTICLYRKMMILQHLLKQNVLPVRNVALRKCQYWQCQWLIVLSVCVIQLNLSLFLLLTVELGSLLSVNLDWIQTYFNLRLTLRC